jgi:hypothetical protein
MVKPPSKFCKKSSYSKNKTNNNNLLINPPIQKKNKTNRGRPKKFNLTPFAFTLEDLFLQPSLIQTTDLFPEISTILLRDFAKNQEKEDQKKKHELWISDAPSYDRVKEEIKFDMNYKKENEKQKFFEFMTVVMNRTIFSLGLHREPGDLLIDINNSFCHCFQIDDEKKVKDWVWEKIFTNELYKKKVEKYFDPDRELFHQIIETLFKWKKMFLNEFDNELL